MNPTQTLNRVRDNVFSQIHASNLVYNTCWEDPRIDRQLMALDGESQVVMITSAGCNALDYLLDNPQSIHCIDMNPRQNALLALKLALFRNGSHDDLYGFFGRGTHLQARELYYSQLRDDLTPEARPYWDKHIGFFHPQPNGRTFYYRGSSGTFAWYFRQYLQGNRKGRAQVEQLLQARSLEAQKEAYEVLEKRVLHPFVAWIMNRHMTMSMLGVPRAQRRLILDQYPGKLSGFLRDALRRVFTELPVQDNYFWQVYLRGYYTSECCPEYLRPAAFDTVWANQHRIHHYTTTIADFLKRYPGRYTHYVLLDHQDWLAAHDEKALEEEWQLILANSRPGTKILLRSAALEIDFLPEFVHQQVEVKPIDPRLHHADRVGTYASAYMGVVH